MKIAGIIAEYNPFHNGHAYHIEETRKQTGCDYIIAVISGDFVQRGAPCVFRQIHPYPYGSAGRRGCAGTAGLRSCLQRKPLPGQGFVSLTV